MTGLDATSAQPHPRVVGRCRRLWVGPARCSRRAEPYSGTQTPGPFYPRSFPQDSDNDLLHVAGHPWTARGVPTEITGRIMDPSGKTISGARIEIWQCDANGRYHYVRDDRANQPRDDDFQGYGATTTDGTGAYQFLTIKPV